jgi:hypothetical protein
MSITLIVTLCLGLIPMLFLLMAGLIGLGLRLWWGDAPPCMFPLHLWSGEPAPEEPGEMLDRWARWWVKWGTITAAFWLLIVLAVLASGI